MITPYETLIEQESSLALQLKVVRDYIKAFYPDKPTAEEMEIEAMLKASRRNLDRNQAKKPRNGKKKTIKKGKPKVSIPDKVKKALEVVGVGKTQDVANKMAELFPEYQKNPAKALKDARFHISASKREKEIEVVEEGIGNSGSTYRLKPVETEKTA